MGFFTQFFAHPQQLWLRRANFQIHLWAGVLLSVYLILIGFTGSILVFGLELSRLVDPNPWPGIALPSTVADMPQVIENLRTVYPHSHIVSLMAPTPIEPVFVANLLSRGERMTVACHPATGQLLGLVHRKPSQLDWIYDLHENLLARRTGRVVNGTAAAALILLALTGLVNWWPGFKYWTRAVKIDFRRRWRRVNFDIHSAVGFWSFGFLIVWAASGIYFTWPEKVLSLINGFSPIINARPPAVSVNPQSEISNLDFRAMLTRAYAVDPGAQWKGIIFPSSRRSPFQLLMSRSPGVGRDNEDTVFFNPYNSEYISTWHYGEKKSLGDWLIWLQTPLHFGTHWGLAVKCLWAFFGLSLPILAVSGLLMYWNRVLRKVLF